MSDFKTAMTEASRLMLVKREKLKRTAAIERERFDEDDDLEQDDADVAAYFDAQKEPE